MSGFRYERIASDMVRFLTEIISNDVRDPRVYGITVVRVDLSHDMKNANVVVASIDNPEPLVALNRCKGFIRHELALNMKSYRCVPELNFVVDKTYKNYEKITTLIKDISNDKKS